MDDVNQATFAREVERTVPDESGRKTALANFAKASTASERVALFRSLRGGSMTAKSSTKLGGIPHQG